MNRSQEGANVLDFLPIQQSLAKPHLQHETTQEFRRKDQFIGRGGGIVLPFVSVHSQEKTFRYHRSYPGFEVTRSKDDGVGPPWRRQ